MTLTADPAFEAAVQKVIDDIENSEVTKLKATVAEIEKKFTQGLEKERSHLKDMVDALLTITQRVVEHHTELHRLGEKLILLEQTTMEGFADMSVKSQAQLDALDGLEAAVKDLAARIPAASGDPDLVAQGDAVTSRIQAATAAVAALSPLPAPPSTTPAPSAPSSTPAPSAPSSTPVSSDASSSTPTPDTTTPTPEPDPVTSLVSQ